MSPNEWIKLVKQCSSRILLCFLLGLGLGIGLVGYDVLFNEKLDEAAEESKDDGKAKCPFPENGPHVKAVAGFCVPVDLDAEDPHKLNQLAGRKNWTCPANGAGIVCIHENVDQAVDEGPPANGEIVRHCRHCKGCHVMEPVQRNDFLLRQNENVSVRPLDHLTDQIH